MEFVPFALPQIEEDEIDAVTECLRSGWLTTGTKAAEFEARFADTLGGGAKAVAVNSATAGLHLALLAAGVESGDEVITSTYTFTATAEAIRYVGAVPVLVDIDGRTGLMDPSAVRAKVTNRTKAIIPVHFAGQVCDMDELTSIASEAGIPIIEDAAHAFPATYKGRQVGLIGDLTVFSFYATKPITTGEGGMIVTRDDEYVERMRRARLHGIDRDVFDRYRSKRPSWYYEVVELGFKYNLTDVAASVGICQLAKAEQFRAKREAIAREYTQALSEFPLTVPYVNRADDMHSWHLYVIQLELERLSMTRDAVIQSLADAGIGTSVHFIPLHQHPYWARELGTNGAEFPHANAMFERAISLPIYPKMSHQAVTRVIETLKTILSKAIR